MTEFQNNVMTVICPTCAMREPLNLHNWNCPQCADAWEPFSDKKLEISEIHGEESGIWRYKDWMDISIENPLSLGAGGTSLLGAIFQGREVLFKTEYLNPSGSFKDRGTELMINVLDRLGAKSVVEDSSGNAGASLAAYAARAGIPAEIYVPENASPYKLAQIAMYGARVKRIPGVRANASLAVKEVVQKGEVYASHAWHPAFLLGQESVAWEVWEQLGHHVPDVWVTPVGQGGHFLGIWMGFKRLLEAGLIDHLPKMVAVQSASVAPIYKIFNNNLIDLPEMDTSKTTTIAEGVVVAQPIRWKQIIHALHESKGFAIAIEEKEILPARRELAHSGFFVEPTSALTAAALPIIFGKFRPTDTIVISLTGNGLKVPVT